MNQEENMDTSSLELAGRDKTVIFIDDDMDLRMLFGIYLRQSYGVATLACANQHDLEALLERIKGQDQGFGTYLFLFDCQLSGQTGPRIMLNIKDGQFDSIDPTIRDIPVMLMTNGLQQSIDMMDGVPFVRKNELTPRHDMSEEARLQLPAPQLLGRMLRDLGTAHAFTTDLSQENRESIRRVSREFIRVMFVMEQQRRERVQHVDRLEFPPGDRAYMDHLRRKDQQRFDDMPDIDAHMQIVVS